LFCTEAVILREARTERKRGEGDRRTYGLPRASILAVEAQVTFVSVNGRIEILRLRPRGPKDGAEDTKTRGRKLRMTRTIGVRHGKEPTS